MTYPIPYFARALQLIALGALVVLSSGCASLRYYGQAVSGHFDLVSRAQPLHEVLQRNDLKPEIRSRLERARDVRRFATEEMGLPANGSYTYYADVGRPYVVWNVVATPEFSVKPRRWCYFFIGCVSYRGYFDPDDARAEARRLKDQGLDVFLGGSQAYSTLGWFDDPLLNTFIKQPDAQLVNIIVHELAHQRLYIKHATAFNEGFATAVAREGVRRWFLQKGEDGAFDRYVEAEDRRSEFHELLIATRERLRRLYRRPIPESAMRREKEMIFAELERQYGIFKQRWGGYSGYDSYMAKGLNNADLSLVATYQQHVPAFGALIRYYDGDMEAFYREAARIGNLPKAQCDAELASLHKAAEPPRGTVVTD